MKFSKDIKRYTDYSGKSAFLMLLTQQGLWALLQYRFFNWIYTSKWPKVVKWPLLGIGVLKLKGIEVLTGITIPYSATIGEGFYIGHHSGIIINANAVIGVNCNVSQGVTIGVSGREENRGVPVIGDHVYIGANATVAGNIIVGNKAVIGANSLVIKDVEEGTTVLGVPAIKVSDNDSADYIL
ncbi:hexapeptide transferase family protein [Nonlabens ulvanivorans]|uniref:Serine acetyltransferase n=1 Tax=Nonlabens ulvanivorans TaxID=906888 RepID=A0A090QVA8_NONUL|nr:serine acetyltransferase [Nonlabens ulvanivorans]GAK99376.1 hexapeptide transferase family protein [Nonlabens ulvanivorans]